MPDEPSFAARARPEPEHGRELRGKSFEAGFGIPGQHACNTEVTFLICRQTEPVMLSVAPRARPRSAGSAISSIFGSPVRASY